MAKSSELKNALVTGGTDGLGRAAAVLLAEQGYRVFATGRNAERRAQLDDLARKKKLPLTTVEMDVREDASVERALDEVRSESGPIDVLVNNAGIGYFAVMEEIRMEDLRQQFETNFFGAVRLIQRVLPEMRERKRGCIVNVSSIAGKYSFPLFGPYSASKHALEAMSDALRMEVRPFGIRVALVEPGYIPTGFQAQARELTWAYVKDVEASPYAQLYKNYGASHRQSMAAATDTPEDCARVILRAVRAERPKARYTVTRQAQALSLAKRILPDALLDRSIGNRLGWK